MPRIEYTKYNPKPESLEIIGHADEILQEYAAQGFDATLRMLYYQFISRDLFPASYENAVGIKNTIQSYNKLKSIISAAREGGLLDWDHLSDRGRSSESRPHWENHQEFIRVVAPQFNIDIWEDQPQRVEVWVEKDGLSSIVERACRPLDVPYTACKGYMSASTIWDAARNRMLRNWNLYKQPTVVLHLGDHDPSGIDMTRDITERLRLFSSQTIPDLLERNGQPQIAVQRIALTMDQIREYNPPPNPAKETDSRFADYQAIHGDESWELDSLTPQVIVNLITEQITLHMHQPRYKRRRKLESDQRTQLIRIPNNWTAIQELLETATDDDATDEGEE